MRNFFLPNKSSYMPKSKSFVVFRDYQKRIIWEKIFIQIEMELRKKQIPLHIFSMDEYRRKGVKRFTREYLSKKNVSGFNLYVSMKVLYISIEMYVRKAISIKNIFFIVSKAIKLLDFLESKQCDSILMVRGFKEPEILVAAKALGIQIYAMQHGDYYHKEYKKNIPNEGMVDTIFLWDDASKEYCLKQFANLCEFIVPGPLWAISYNGLTRKRSHYDVALYLSSSDAHEKFVMNEVVKLTSISSIVIPHPSPVVISPNLSCLDRSFFDVGSLDLSKEQPLVAIVFDSTVVQELVHVGVPVLYVESIKGSNTANKPSTLCFNTNKLDRLGAKLALLLSQDATRGEVVSKQRAELGLATLDGQLVLRNVLSKLLADRAVMRSQSS